MDYFHYSEQSLSKMKLHELRELALQIGVKSPTVFKKEELVQEIVKLTEHNTIDEINRNISKDGKKKKPGRPQKSAGTLSFSDSTQDLKELRKREEQYNMDTLSDMGKFDTFFAEEPKPSFSAFDNEMAPSYSEDKVAPSYSEDKPAQPQVNRFKKTLPQYSKSDNEQVTQERLQRQYYKKSNDDAQEGEKTEPEVMEVKEGVLEILPDGYGFLRAHNYEAGDGDAYISSQKIKMCGLRKGDWVKAEAQKNNENRPRVCNILSVNNRAPEAAMKRKNFDSLTPIYPNERFRLEIPNAMNDFAIRCIDMIAPIGKGQRAMIVSPPKAGKTTFLKKVARSISTNYPDVHLIVLLIDERPEEVTDMKRCINGEVIFSTFDEMPEHHTKAAEMVLERAKRLVELGEDVVILMDSLTRLARAYNLTIAPTGRTLSGGVDPGALHSPKRFFGAARNIEFGGSLTIIATALVDTGSRMDDVIYEEFKGTGNMEIHLDRRLSEKRIFPAIDLYKSSTRMEELLLDQSELQGVWAMRKLLGQGDSSDATENLLNMIVKTRTNKEFLEQVNLQVMALQKRGFDIK